MTRATLFQPMLSSILRDRRLGAVISIAALLQLAATWLGLPGWICPIFHTFGIPCPGCGMTRAAVFLFHGDFKQALTMHAFAPLFLVAFAVIAFSSIAPRTFVDHIIARTETFERYTGFTFLLLSGLILYWLARLLILQTAFIRLIQG